MGGERATRQTKALLGKKEKNRRKEVEIGEEAEDKFTRWSHYVAFKSVCKFFDTPPVSGSWTEFSSPWALRHPSSQWRAPQSKGVRCPATSQVRTPAGSSRTTQVFRCLRPPATAWLQVNGTPWARTIQARLLNFYPHKLRDNTCLLFETIKFEVICNLQVTNHGGYFFGEVDYSFCAWKSHHVFRMLD